MHGSHLCNLDSFVNETLTLESPRMNCERYDVLLHSAVINLKRPMRSQ